MLARRVLFPSALLAASLLSAAAPAEACSGAACWGGHLLPAAGEVPATLSAVLWTPRSGVDGVSPDASGVHMVRLTDEGEIDVAVTVEPEDSGAFLVKIAEPLEPGAAYVVRGEKYCLFPDETEELFTESLIHAANAAALPTSLGDLDGNALGVASLDVWTSSGACSASIQADQVEISLALSAEAEPWKNALVFETWVDGERWQPSGYPGDIAPGSSWRGRGADLLFTNCESNDPGADRGLMPGSHLVWMRATLPGTDVVIESKATTVSLSCGWVDECDWENDPSCGWDECDFECDDEWDEGDWDEGPKGAWLEGDVDAGGCSVGAAPSRASGIAGIGLLLGIGALAARRRRERR